MKLRACLIVMMVFLLVVTMNLTIKVEHVKASGTIYIRSDGLVFPSNAPIHRDGNIYTLTDNIINGSIVVLRDNIVLDGAGLYRIEGPGLGEYGSLGIDLTGRSNITIRNMEITSFWYGVLLNMTSNIQINGITADNYYDVNAWNSSSVIIHRNNLTYIEFVYSSNNVVSENNIEYVRFMYDSEYNIICRNHISNVGIEIDSNTLVFENNITDCGTSSLMIGGSYNKIYRNNVVNGSHYGIHVWWYSTNNIIYNNNIRNNSWAGIYLDRADENMIFHNNFADNGKNVFADPEANLNLLDAGYPAGGNYWSNYTGVDEKSGSNQDQPVSDGIGDTPHVIEGFEWTLSDNYPLMGPINIFEAGTWDQIEYFVDVVSNSTISNFHFNPAEGAFIRFNSTGETGKGFCRVTIPKDLLWVEDEKWEILVDDQQINYTMFEDVDFTYLYFTYNHSTKTVLIQGTNVIPEFPTATLLLTFLTLTAIPLIFAKKKNIRKTRT